MTDEELDRARSQEAHRMWADGRPDGYNFDVAATAARLAREGWTPPDPLQVEAQEIAHRYLGDGRLDPVRHVIIESLCVALSRGIKIGRDHG